METETIQKNVASPKSQTSRRNLFNFILISCLFATSAFLFTGCGKDDAEKINPNNQFAGTWTKDNNPEWTVTVVIKETTWVAKVDNETYNSGTYTYTGNTAQWKITNKGMGSANVGETGNAAISNNKMIVSSFSDEYMNGQYTKQ